MALSDQLTQLANRAKELEDRVAASTAKSKADLQQDVKNAREAAQSQGDALRKSAEDSKGKISAWWDSVQRSWNDHLAAVRENIDEKRSEHDLKTAQRAADSAEEDATFAIDFAFAAIDEAEYAVLDAELARMNADELAGGSTTG
jgi:DNA anti-recombination protein RmuC